MEYLLRTEWAASVEPVIIAADVDLHTPALCDIEVAAALRRGLLAGSLSQRRTHQALDDYGDLPLTRHGHHALLRRIVALRHNFSAYDAAYVALAETVGAELLTADEALARAARKRVKLA